MAVTNHATNAFYLRTGIDSDFVLECQGQIFRLHKMIVSHQSPVLDLDLQGPCDPIAIKTIHVDASFDLDTVKSMIDYLYMETYSINTLNTEPSSGREASTDHDRQKSIFLYHLEVFRIGLHYKVPGLMAVVTIHIKSLLKEPWPAEIFPDIASRALEMANEGPLSDILVEAAVKRLSDLVDVEEFEKLARYPMFMVEVVRAFVKNIEIIHADEAYDD